jgi:tRNA(adenine34) deaminase
LSGFCDVFLPVEKLLLLNITKEMKRNIRKIPKFKNEDEEREFWSKHNSTDYIDWKKGKRAKLPSFKQSTNINSNEHFMRLAIDQAKIAEENGDVPIGAVIVYKEQIIAKAYNQREQLKDPTAHAEIIALTQAAAALENWHLNGCTIYVTLEPCPMCAGALVLSRIDRLVYGCDDPKTGACKSLYNIVQNDRLNHRVEVSSGILADECSQQLQEFFKRRRTGNLE